MEYEPIIPDNEICISHDPFDRKVWKDKQEILQAFDVSERTLQRWREEGRIRMLYFKGKFWYHVDDAAALYKEKHKKKDLLASWPIAIHWTGFWLTISIMLHIPTSFWGMVFTMLVPLTIVGTADIILRIRKRRKKKKIQL